MSRTGPARLLRRFAADQCGANAVEFALLAIPFVLLLLFALQMGLFAMTKMSLDTGVLRAAENLQARFSTTTAPSLPSASGVKTTVAAKSGGLVANTSSLAVEVRPLAALSTAVTPITDGAADFGAPRTVLVVRASYATPVFVPGLGSVLTAYSSTLVRRQSL